MSSVTASAWSQTGLLAQLVSDNKATQAQLDKLTEQTSSGLVSQTYGGLGTSASVAINLSPQLDEISSWQTNISMASTTLSVSQSVLGQISSIVSTFSSSTLGTDMETASGAQSLATEASQALTQVVSLLNTSSGGQYTFAGTDSSNPPISTSELSNFVSSIATQVDALSSGSDADTVTSAVVTAGTDSDFAYPGSSSTGTTPSALSTPVGTSLSVPTAFVAGVNTFSTSSGTYTTGSYVRDIITGLAALAGLSDTSASETTLQSFGSNISSLLQSATGALTTEEAGFGEVQDELTTQASELSDTQTALKTQVSSVEDADMTTTATEVSEIQTQLQASYKLIAETDNLTLTQYL